MYKREEASKLRKEFWVIFGRLIKPQLSAEGERINWVNYKTGVKDVYFRMDANNKMASIGIEIVHADLELQELYFDQFKDFKDFFAHTMKEEWTWALHAYNANGAKVSRVYTELDGVSVFKQDDWSRIISFFKTRMVRLDQFWSVVRYEFMDF